MNPQLPKLTDLVSELKIKMQQNLPGPQAHIRMEPITRNAFLNLQHPTPPRQSAVLILLFEEDGKTKTTFIKRNIYDGVHSGQIAFPGGRYEEYDNDLINTALRETEEEVGIPREDVKVLGALSKIYIPPSNFDVLPVVGYSHKIPRLVIDPNEVSEAFFIDLEALVSPGSLAKNIVTLKDGMQASIPCYKVSDYIIWGATAMILSEFNEIVSPIRP
jgi:8-oxo-dGTP pyrophosphatase MutT (NUDIX family)